MKVSRNQPCPCGSGTKTKKCHPRLAGLGDGLVEAQRWYDDCLAALASMPDYAPPPPVDQRLTYRRTGCPYGVCTYESDWGLPCAAGCGV